MLRLIISLTLLSLSLANIVKRSEYTLFSPIHFIVYYIAGDNRNIICVTIAKFYDILNTVLHILGGQRTIIVTASTIISDFIYTQCISTSFSQFSLCKAFN